MTLREQLSLFNFRDIYDKTGGMYSENTRTVRIYFGVSDWFEFGVYDFDDKTESRIEKALNKKVLDSEITSIGLTEHFTLLEIWLEN